ncbi:hypothetical protein DFH28DRAFT_840749, partial [Melampsora americana]
LLQIHGFSLVRLKQSLYKAWNNHKKPCGDLLKIADGHGQMAFKGYVVNSSHFGKTAMPLITDNLVLNKFQE